MIGFRSKATGTGLREGFCAASLRSQMSQENPSTFDYPGYSTLPEASQFRPRGDKLGIYSEALRETPLACRIGVLDSAPSRPGGVRGCLRPLALFAWQRDSAVPLATRANLASFSEYERSTKLAPQSAFARFAILQSQAAYARA